MSESMLACRTGDLDLLLPFEGVERILPLFEVTTAGDRLELDVGSIPLIRLGACLGVAEGTSPLSAGVVVLSTEGERVGVVADSFQGLVTVSSESSFRVPLGWILGQPSLPYRAFHVFDGRIVAELAPFHLLVSPTAEESWPSPEDGTMDDPPGRYLIVSVGTFLVALPLSSVAQITDTMGLCRYPRLPAPVLGMVLYRGTPVPVLRLLESSVHDGAIVVLRNQAGHLGVAVDATRGMADLFPPFVPEASVPPDFLGGCTVLHADHSPAPVFTVDPDRLWRSLAR